MRIWISTAGTTLVAVFLLAACYAPSRRHVEVESDQHAVLMAILAHMVTNADESKTLVRFVEIPSAAIQELRERCGSSYMISPVSEAEVKQMNPMPDETVAAREKGFYLKNTDKEGAILRVENIRVDRLHAEAVASYQGRLSGAGFRYKLKYSPSGWCITSVEDIASI